MLLHIWKSILIEQSGYSWPEQKKKRSKIFESSTVFAIQRPASCASPVSLWTLSHRHSLRGALQKANMLEGAEAKSEEPHSRDIYSTEKDWQLYSSREKEMEHTAAKRKKKIEIGEQNPTETNKNTVPNQTCQWKPQLDDWYERWFFFSSEKYFWWGSVLYKPSTASVRRVSAIHSSK